MFKGLLLRMPRGWIAPLIAATASPPGAPVGPAGHCAVSNGVGALSGAVPGGDISAGKRAATCAFGLPVTGGGDVAGMTGIRGAGGAACAGAAIGTAGLALEASSAASNWSCADFLPPAMVLASSDVAEFDR